MALIAPVSIAVLGLFSQVVTSEFDVFNFDYINFFKDFTNVFVISSYSAASAYILKNLLTDDNKNFLGIETKN